jgi:hypothetical protein
VAQKDPREYLPALKELSELPELERHAKIDMQLKRYASALEHLSKVQCLVQFYSCQRKKRRNKECLEGERTSLQAGKKRQMNFCVMLCSISFLLFTYSSSLLGGVGTGRTGAAAHLHGADHRAPSLQQGPRSVFRRGAGRSAPAGVGCAGLVPPAEEASPRCVCLPLLAV